MLRLVGLIAQATLLLLITYNVVTSLWGWPNRSPGPTGDRRRLLRVVIPAHNEAGVIGGILTDLAGSRYPSDRLEVRVVADACTDDTVEVARNLGFEVLERTDGGDGKGQALAWYLEQQPLPDAAALVVLDADNRIGPEVLGRIADELDAGATVVQCYLDATSPVGSVLAEASALSYWAGNRMVQLARANLGWSADLGGTGMAINSRALEAAGGFSSSLAEDQDLGVRLLLAGHRVQWIHDVRVADEKPRSLGVTVRQRARWMAGKRATRRRHLVALLRQPSAPRLDMAIRLIQPGRSFIALVTGVFAIWSAVHTASWLLPWQVWAVVAAVQVLQPIPFLARDGVSGARLARYPALALIAALWIPVRLVSSVISRWYHTPHVGSTSDASRETGP